MGVLLIMAGIRRVDRVLPDEHHRRHQRDEEQKEGQFSRFVVEFSDDDACRGLLSRCSARRIRLVGGVKLWEHFVNCFTGSLDREKNEALLSFAEGEEVLNEEMFERTMCSLQGVLIGGSSNEDEKVRALSLMLQVVEFLRGKGVLCIKTKLSSALIAFSTLSEFLLKDASKERIVQHHPLIRKELLKLVEGLYEKIQKATLTGEQKSVWLRAEANYKTLLLRQRLD